MKALIISAFFALPASGQVSIGIGAGTSNKWRPTMELQVGAEMNHVHLQAGFNAHLSSRVTDPAVFFVMGGYGFAIGENVRVNPAAGYAYELHSFDLPELNRTGLILGCQFEKTIGNTNGRWLIGYKYINKTSLFTIGIKGILR